MSQRRRASHLAHRVLLVEPSRPAVVRSHPRAPWFAVATVCFGAFMGQLDASVVTLAFPAVQRDFSAGLAAVQWISLAYLVTLVALLVPVGRASDRYGRKLVYLYGFGLFTAASVACGLAGSLTALVALRVVQAAGAAMLQANSVALVVTSVPAARRRAALGVQAAAQALGLALGPTLGGLLVATVGWRWVFWINLPVGAAALVAGWFLLPRTIHRASSRGTDPLGLVLLGLATTGLLVSMSAASGLRLLPVAAWVPLLVAAGAGTAFGWWERRAPRPLLDVRLLAAPRVAAGLLGALCAYLVLFGPLVLYPQTLAGRGTGTADAGLVLTALPAGFAVAAVLADRLLPARWSDRRRCLLGGLVAAGATGLLALRVPGAGTVLPLALLGLALGTFLPANNAAVMSCVPGTRAATMGGMVNMTRGLGTAMGVALVTLMLHLGTALGYPGVGPTLSLLALVGVALVAASTGLAALTSPGTPPAGTPAPGRATPPRSAGSARNSQRGADPGRRPAPTAAPIR